MNKEDLITQANRIYQALNVISVHGYGDIKTLGNCLDALQELIKNINSYEEDIQNVIKEQIENLTKNIQETQCDSIVPVDSSKPKPQRIKKEVNANEQNRDEAV